MTDKRISKEFPYTSQYAEVYGSKMHYIEAGSGDPILFLHGVPTSCYLWRNVIPHLARLGRCIAPDLMGFGKSDRPNIEYTVSDHIRYVEKFIETLNLKKLTLVMHGWGSVIGFDIAMRNEKNYRGLAFYEAFLRHLDMSDFSLPFQEQLISLQEDEAVDTAMMGPAYIDKMIPATVMRSLSEEEMNAYREPFKRADTVKPIVQYLSELSDKQKRDKINQVIEHYSKKLAQSNVPKLMLYSVPGFITTIATAMWAKDHLPHLEIVDIGEELHLAQETCPELIGETISVWIQGLDH